MRITILIPLTLEAQKMFAKFACEPNRNSISNLLCYVGMRAKEFIAIRKSL